MKLLSGRSFNCSLNSLSSTGMKHKMICASPDLSLSTSLNGFLMFISQTAGLSHTPRGGVLPAHTDCDNTLQPGVKQLQHGIEEKASYASTITNPSSSCILCTRHDKEKIITEQSTHNSVPAVIFKATDCYSIMAEDCKYTLVGQFLKSRPQIDQIRSKFKEKVTMKGSAKIGVFGNYNVFIDLINQESFSNQKEAEDCLVSKSNNNNNINKHVHNKDNKPGK
ncbi:hypothetical protein KY290_022201 [Solanum tuberosum]|uniref:Uncharacterized protein n=1 Tax=Solanum tuberosum TaxID=4113 RepID=A0ABQ7V5S2_SOLTU|nr:hypothetical protein KY289_021332 [Solanum tuberosum]KAH0758708.1 hypothetical protein KY290_022201 [Solanum tuberosum]